MAKHVYVKFGVLAASVFEILSGKKQTISGEKTAQHTATTNAVGNKRPTMTCQRTLPKLQHVDVALFDKHAQQAVKLPVCVQIGYCHCTGLRNL